jgi:hypothetical protein
MENNFENFFGIIIANSGWVFVGDIKVHKSFSEIKNCNVIRRWGTTKGLGQLAIEGPLEKTVLDFCGDIIVPINSQIAIFKSKKTLWLK